MPNHPILVHKIIKLRDAVPKSLFVKLEQHRSLIREIKPLLPHFLRQHVMGCATKDRRLLIFTTSSAWASQLRFYSPSLLQTLNKQFNLEIELLQIQILPPKKPHTATRNIHHIPSKQTLEHLKRYSIALNDSELKQSLMRLTQSLEKRARHSRDQP